MTESERRHEERVQQYTVVGIECGDQKDRVGITRNVSPTGALFHSASHFEVGQELTLIMVPTGTHDEVRFAATVVRTQVEPLTSDSHFPHLTAVEFPEPIDWPDDPED